MLKIHGVGGYDEVGKNMTAIEHKDDVMLCDAGLYLPAIVGVSEREKIPTESGMRALGALPDDNYLAEKNLKEKVRAILVSHAHLDHVGAVQYVAPKYKAGVYGTPYTIEILKTLMEDRTIPNKLNSIQPNGHTFIQGKEKYKVEFINMTHSTIQCAIVAVHTPDGVILYANDYKLDNTPVLGEKPNYKRLKELSKQGVKALIVNCLYAHADYKTPSEKIARGLLEDVMFTTENHKSALIVTTFASHIARLKSITDFGEKLGRKVVFVGRSLQKYVSAGIKVNQVPFKNKIIMAAYKSHKEKILKQINSNRSKYLLVCTGHQGEEGAVLDRISRNTLPFKLQKDDHIIFSSKTIPSPENIAQKSELQKRLRQFSPRIFDNIHVSGHGAQVDLRDLITLTNPEHVIPSHGDHSKTSAGMALAEEMGYKKNYNVHLLSNGKKITI
ncbi:MBL fold metallo-hydrolase [Candidatus Pacearchaeota archaeon]|nr:MBL fold metallo-hydrolase [Candidatus Pacearchaeota archaeon]